MRSTSPQGSIEISSPAHVAEVPNDTIKGKERAGAKMIMATQIDRKSGAPCLLSFRRLRGRGRRFDHEEFYGSSNQQPRLHLKSAAELFKRRVHFQQNLELRFEMIEMRNG